MERLVEWKARAIGKKSKKMIEAASTEMSQRLRGNSPATNWRDTAEDLRVRIRKAYERCNKVPLDGREMDRLLLKCHGDVNRLAADVEELIKPRSADASIDTADLAVPAERILTVDRSLGSAPDVTPPSRRVATQELESVLESVASHAPLVDAFAATKLSPSRSSSASSMPDEYDSEGDSALKDARADVDADADGSTPTHDVVSSLPLDQRKEFLRVVGELREIQGNLASAVTNPVARLAAAAMAEPLRVLHRALEAAGPRDETSISCLNADVSQPPLAVEKKCRDVLRVPTPLYPDPLPAWADVEVMVPSCRSHNITALAAVPSPCALSPPPRPSECHRVPVKN